MARITRRDCAEARDAVRGILVRIDLHHPRCPQCDAPLSVLEADAFDPATPADRTPVHAGVCGFCDFVIRIREDL